MQIVICDDLKEEREILKGYIHHSGSETSLDYIIMEFESAEALLSAMKAQTVHPDILFMDIYLKGMTGIEAAKIMLSDGYQGSLIFTTTSMNHALDSYEMMANGYLVKPYRFENFQRNFERVLQGYEKSFKSISFLCDRLEFRVFLKDIEYIEASIDRGCVVYAKGEALRTSKAITEFAQELEDEKQFLQCHRSCILNLQFVAKVEENEVRMKDGKLAPLARANRQTIRKAVADYFFLKMREEE